MHSVQPTSLLLRPTQLSDLDFVMAAERHPENEPFVNQWAVSQHKEAISSANDGHFIAEQAMKPIGYVILTGLQDPHQSITLGRTSE